MKLIRIEDVHVPEERQRREFLPDAIRELADSIRAVGLLQPIVLRSDGKTLVAGERRYRAIREYRPTFHHDSQPVPAGVIPYVLLTDLSPELLFQAELEENLRRVNLTWQEEARAVAQFHRNQQTINPDQTFASTSQLIADTVGTSILPDTVSNAVLLEEFLDDPLIAAAKDIKTAKKIARDLAKAREREANLSTFLSVKNERFHLFNSDSLTDSLNFPQYFDCIVTDPPYGINMHKKDTFDEQVHEYDDSPANFNRLISTLPGVFRQILKPNGHIYLFCDIRKFNQIFIEFFSNGFDVWPRPLIWDKGTTGSFTNTDFGFRQCYDAILFARLGQKKLVKYARDVINIQQKIDLPHPAGKPAELIAELISRSCLAGERVADLFCGHGPIFPAAQLTNTIAYGWEIHPKYYAMAAETRANTLKEL